MLLDKVHAYAPRRATRPISTGAEQTLSHVVRPRLALAARRARVASRAGAPRAAQGGRRHRVRGRDEPRARGRGQGVRRRVRAGGVVPLPGRHRGRRGAAAEVGRQGGEGAVVPAPRRGDARARRRCSLDRSLRCGDASSIPALVIAQIELARAMALDGDPTKAMERAKVVKEKLPGRPEGPALVTLAWARDPTRGETRAAGRRSDDQGRRRSPRLLAVRSVRGPGPARRRNPRLGDGEGQGAEGARRRRRTGRGDVAREHRARHRRRAARAKSGPRGSLVLGRVPAGADARRARRRRRRPLRRSAEGDRGAGPDLAGRRGRPRRGRLRAARRRRPRRGRSRRSPPKRRRSLSWRRSGSLPRSSRGGGSFRRPRSSSTCPTTNLRGAISSRWTPRSIRGTWTRPTRSPPMEGGRGSSPARASPGAPLALRVAARRGGGRFARRAEGDGHAARPRRARLRAGRAEQGGRGGAAPRQVPARPRSARDVAQRVRGGVAGEGRGSEGAHRDARPAAGRARRSRRESSRLRRSRRCTSGGARRTS